MVGAGDEMDVRTRKSGSYSGDIDNDGRKKRANRVNHDLSRSIYRGVHLIR
jgi:hypothetical protein